MNKARWVLRSCTTNGSAFRKRAVNFLFLGYQPPCVGFFYLFEKLITTFLLKKCVSHYRGTKYWTLDCMERAWKNARVVAPLL